MTKLGQTAIVAGRSMGGLAAAAALSKHFERVLIIDKDPLSSGAEPRPGVGQGHHLHNLLRSGELSIEKLLPGACAERISTQPISTIASTIPPRRGLTAAISPRGFWGLMGRGFVPS